MNTILKFSDSFSISKPFPKIDIF